MNVSIQLKVKSFIRDPNDTDLGRKIIENSILLIDQLGFEAFTFKKLASIIDSTEASVYRYFENKHKLLIYLISWYWSWLEYRLNVEFLKVHKPEQKLDFFLKVITTPGNVDSEFKFVNGVALHRIVVSESPKAFLTKDVDADNKDGYFRSYKVLVHMISNVVLEVNSAYPYPTALVTTIIESAYNQQYFIDHFKTLSETRKKGDLEKFLSGILYGALNVKPS